MFSDRFVADSIVCDIILCDMSLAYWPNEGVLKKTNHAISNIAQRMETIINPCRRIHTFGEFFDSTSYSIVYSLTTCAS